MNIEKFKKMIAEDVTLTKYDVVVKPYIESAVIKVIAENCVSGDYITREMTKDGLILKYCTNFNIDEIKTEDYDIIKQCGLIQAVKDNIINLESLEEAIKYEISVEKSMIEIKESMSLLLDKSSKAVDKITKSLPKNKKGWSNFLKELK